MNVLLKLFNSTLYYISIKIFFIINVSTLIEVNCNENLPLIINTWDFLEANKIAWNTLITGINTSLDALVDGLTACEEQQCGTTVGYGGSPDENGETTLDAMIMDGRNMNMGAVGGLRQIKHAARVARLVLEHTEHSILVGDAASNFAEMMGMQRQSLTTPFSKALWQKWWQSNCQPNFWRNVIPDSRQYCGPYKPHEKSLQGTCTLMRYYYEVNQWNHDTIGMIVIDKVGHIFAGTSTNGAKHKIPGRVGDSPIPGAGAYSDNEIGAAVATGDGDVMMRFLPALLAVENLRLGKTPEEAAIIAIKRIKRHYTDFSGALVVADRWGNYSAACVGIKIFPYTIAFGNVTSKIQYKNCLNNTNLK